MLANKNQAPKQQKLQDLNKIKQLKTNSKLKIINYVLNQCLYYKDNYYESEFTIAKRMGISVRTVNRIIALAKSLGLIKRKRRINNSNIYSINPALRDPYIIDQLASVLPALRGLLCLSILIPLTTIYEAPSRRCAQKFGVQYKKEEDLNVQSKCKTVYLSTKKEGLLGTREAQAPDAFKKYEKREELKGDLRSQDIVQSALVCYNKAYSPHKQCESNAMAMYKLGDLVESTLQIDMQKFCAETGHYNNNKAAREFKEFVTERLPRLKESLASLDLTSAKKSEIVQRQLQSYIDNLNLDDRLLLRSEGFPI